MTRPRHLIVRNIKRADHTAIDELARMGTATVHEALGRLGSTGPHFRPIQFGASIAGSAITVSCHPGDNLMIHAAIELCQAGDVLVVTNTAPSTHGMFGDLMASSLMARGVRGLVIDAGVRDTGDLRRMGFFVWSQHVSVEGTVKSAPGSVNVPVVLGRQIVNPGDIVCADDDGVIIVGRELAAEAVRLSQARRDFETATRIKLSSGQLGLDIFELRAKLTELGVEYVDQLDD
jgi:4-hydroxy-4-methyl-2-oxoglutarate aldolase